MFEDLAISASAGRGHRLYGAVSPCPLTFEFTLHAPYVFEGLASWLPAMETHEDAALPRTPRERGVSGRGQGRDRSSPHAAMFNGEWGSMRVLKARDAGNERFEGKSVAEAAAGAGKHPLDWLLDLALAEGLDTMFIATLLNSDESALSRMLSDDNALISLSDAGAHLNSSVTRVPGCTCSAIGCANAS